MSKSIRLALVVAVILPLSAISARAGQNSCLGDPRCIVTQNDWAGASEADKHTSAYAAALAAKVEPEREQTEKALAQTPNAK